MNRGLSTYLDLVRVAACLIVFSHHMVLNYGCYDAIGTACTIASHMIPLNAGNNAVIVFFVLSGYVITHVAFERETTLREFALSRCARIYSVAVPILCLTAALAGYAILVQHDPNMPVYQFKKAWKYVPMFLAFTDHHWDFSESPFTHGGWWSLSYEVWYYVIFAAAFFPRGWLKWPAATVAILCVGPKIWALFPCWLLGCAAYRWNKRANLAPAPARALFVATLVAIFLTIESDALARLNDGADALSGGWISANLRSSQWFVGDFLLSILFAANIVAANFAELNFGRLRSAIRILASFTFTFYMIHGLTIEVSIHWFHFGVAATTLITFGSTYLFGLATEHQRERLKRIMTAGLSILEGWSHRWIFAAQRGQL